MKNKKDHTSTFNHHSLLSDSFQFKAQLNCGTYLSGQEFWTEDLVNIIVKCIEKKGLGILNLASGKVYSFKYIAELIINFSKSKSELIKIKRVGPMPHNGYRPFDIQLLKKHIKDIKTFSIKTGIKKYLESYSKI